MRPPEEFAARRAAARARRVRRRRAVAAALVAAIVVAIVAVLASGGGPGRRAPGGRAGTAAAGRAEVGRGYRWLVPTVGPPPSIAAENRAPGSDSWRLPAGIASRAVEGYVSAQDVRPGDVERIYVRAPGARWVRLRIYRMGWYGGRGARLVLESARLRPAAQPRCQRSRATGLSECRWRATLAVAIPAGLASGVYVVKLTTDAGAQRDALFVLEATRPTPLLAQISTATYEAYNAFGGDSLYPGGFPVAATATTQGVAVSYDRPYETDTGAGEFFARDVAIVRFLERYGYPVSYTTNESVDRNPAQLLGARAVLDSGHSEYWSQRAERAFARARDRGVNLAFLGSDTLAWRVRFAPATAASSEAGAADHRIVAYKEFAARDPHRAQPSGAFAAIGGALTGSAYNGCITARLPSNTHPKYRYYAWSPAPGLRPAWLFAGTGLTAAARVPGIVGYELDERSAAAPRSLQVVGSGSAPCMTGRAGTAVTTLYRARSGALVFASGTVGWEFGLSPVPGASPEVPRAPDPRLVRLTRNLLARVLAAPAPVGAHR